MAKKKTTKTNYNGLPQYVFTKQSVKPLELFYMHPALLSIFAYVVNFCANNGVKMVVTEIYSPKGDGRISTTHAEFRAFDLSLRSEYGWNTSKINKLKHLVEGEFKHVGAISKKTYGSRPIVIHDASTDPKYEGTDFAGLHAHFQVRPNALIK